MNTGDRDMIFVGPVGLRQLWHRSIVIRRPQDRLMSRYVIAVLGVAAVVALSFTGIANPFVTGFAVWALVAVWIAIEVVSGWSRAARFLRLIRIESGRRLCQSCGYEMEDAVPGATCSECGQPWDDVTRLRGVVYPIARWVPEASVLPTSELAALLSRAERSALPRRYLHMLKTGTLLIVLLLLAAVALSMLEERAPRASRSIALGLAVLIVPTAIGLLLRERTDVVVEQCKAGISRRSRTP